MPPGVPRALGSPFPIEILQDANTLTILYEYMHLFRRIPTDGRAHPADTEPTFMGDSVGRWEGDTLVVDVTGFNDKTWVDTEGHQHSDALHVIERIAALERTSRLPGHHRRPEDLSAVLDVVTRPDAASGVDAEGIRLRGKQQDYARTAGALR